MFGSLSVTVRYRQPSTSEKQHNFLVEKNKNIHPKRQSCGKRDVERRNCENFGIVAVAVFVV